LKYDRSQIVALSFIILSVGSVVYVSTAALNYLRFYPALSQVQFQTDSISYTSITGSNASALLAQITVRNPTDYSGLILGAVALRIYFYVQSNRSNTLFGNSSILTASQRPLVQLRASSTQHISISVPLSSQEAALLASFNSKYSGQVIADAALRVDIDTFLDSVTGSTSFTRTQDIPLSST